MMNDKNKIIVYSKNNCPRCLFSKRFLDKHGIEYKDINISYDEDALKYVKSLGVKQTPYIESPIGNWSGLNTKKLNELNEEMNGREN